MQRRYSRSSKKVRPYGFRRRAMRRAVEVDCDVRSELWDGAVRLSVSDLSPEGMWIETDLPLEVGDEVLASFSPPGSCLRLHALCEVSRVGMWRRADDAIPSGMALAFTDLTPRDRARLARALIGIPPPLPLEVRQRRARHAARRPRTNPPVQEAALPSVLNPSFTAAG